MPNVTSEKALIHSINFALCCFKGFSADGAQDMTADLGVGFSKKE